MTRRRWIVLSTTFALLLGTTFFALYRQPAEPSYGGKRLSKWVDYISPTSLTRAGPTAVFWTAPRRIRTPDGQVMIIQVPAAGFPRFVSGPFGPTAQYPALNQLIGTSL